MMVTPKVVILLSTFNGSLYLQEQLKSLVAQTHQNWVLCWRDDGSSDDSLSIMRSFNQDVGKDKCFELGHSTDRVGATKSFLWLLNAAPAGDFVAFADQDDVWLPNKIERAISVLSGYTQVPCLYSARQRLVDKDLQGSRLSTKYPSLSTFLGCLTQNRATGHTIVMNQKAADLLTISFPPEITHHDWWCSIVVSACGGQVVFDEQTNTLYRQHKANLIGNNKPFLRRALAALARGPAIYMTVMEQHIAGLLQMEPNLSQEAKKNLNILIKALNGSIFWRLKALSIKEFRRQNHVENILFMIWFAIDRRTKSQKTKFAYIARDIEPFSRKKPILG
jgi:glycosyltransferase involved in cell wall biosynthesis